MQLSRSITPASQRGKGDCPGSPDSSQRALPVPTHHGKSHTRLSKHQIIRDKKTHLSSSYA